MYFGPSDETMLDQRLLVFNMQLLSFDAIYRRGHRLKKYGKECLDHPLLMKGKSCMFAENVNVRKEILLSRPTLL